MSSDHHQLLDMIGSRICHDLISPLGAIGNGVELIAMNQTQNSPEYELIAQSVENANARIRYFRIAFGSASHDQNILQSEILSVLRDVTQRRRMVVDWQAGGEIPRKQVKLAFLLIQCFETSMPWGGHVTISLVGNQWAIYGTAEKMKIDQEIWASLTDFGETTTLAPENVQFALAPLVAEVIGRRLSVELSENSARIRF